MAQAKQPHLVLCDLNMPAMDGTEVAAALRSHFPNLPVVFLTGLVTPTEARDPARAERIISKGAPVHEILHRIQSLIGK